MSDECVGFSMKSTLSLDVSPLLWHDQSMDIIRNKFFLGNDEAKKPRAPHTLKTYVVSFKLFLKFMIARKLSVRRIATVTDNDLQEIESALQRLSSWPSSYKVATQKKKAVNRQKDMKERLDSESFRKLRENKFAEKIKKTFASIKSDNNKTVDIQTFANCRDYILCMLMLDSGQRCGAAANLTMEEYNNGEWTTVDGELLYITQTVVHKTQSDGPAKLFWDKGLKSVADIYVDKMRPLFHTDESMLPQRPGVPPRSSLVHRCQWEISYGVKNQQPTGSDGQEAKPGNAGNFEREQNQKRNYQHAAGHGRDVSDIARAAGVSNDSCCNNSR